MATRAVAAGVLVAAALIAWVTITIPLAARLLQVAIGISVIYVALLALRAAKVLRAALGAQPAPATDGRIVSVVVPARNEVAVIGATVRDVCAQVGVRFEVIVVDDGSVDGTGDAARAAAAPECAVRVVRRDPGSGPATKGAALAFAMPFARGEVVAVVDADGRVAPDFLARALHAWQRDPTAAGLQVARRAANAGASWLTAAQDEEQVMDLTSQCGRWALDGTAELRGNGMFVRRASLDRIGGWGTDALTEDLDLSTRLSAVGEHVTLAPEVTIGEDAVPDVPGLLRQRLRWAEGSLRRLIDHGPRVVAGSVGLKSKLDFLAFTTEFLLPPLFAATILASLVTIPLPQPADWTVPASLFAGYGVGAFLLAISGLASVGVRGIPILGRAVRGALFLSHWLVVVPIALVRIAVLPGIGPFTQTPRARPTAQ
jgi:1,2-diacylglycerol 3-beta-glucosyltransferase